MNLLFRNWHLKLGALALATILYTGLVFSGSFDERTIDVPLDRAGQPECCFLLTDELGPVSVRYRVAVDAGDVRADAFAATFDLSEYDLDRVGEPQAVPVNVRALSDDVSVLGYTPQRVTVVLDRLEEKLVPVRVDRGSLPAGLTLAEPSVTLDGEPLDSVTARGPSSAVNEVVEAVARITIDPSGIDINHPVDLVPVDIDGQEVPAVELEPEAAIVEIEVDEIETTKNVAVRPTVSGTPAAGYAVERLSVSPTAVTLRGTPEALAAIDGIASQPLAIDDATASQSAELELEVPEGVRVVEPDSGVVTVTAEIIPTQGTRTLALGIICQGAGANACVPQLEQASVTIAGPIADLAAVNPIEVSAVVDVAGLGPGEHTLNIAVGLPDGVELVAVSPPSVAVVVQAPATPTPTPTAAP